MSCDKGGVKGVPLGAKGAIKGRNRGPTRRKGGLRPRGAQSSSAVPLSPLPRLPLLFPPKVSWSLGIQVCPLQAHETAGVPRHWGTQYTGLSGSNHAPRPPHVNLAASLRNCRRPKILGNVVHWSPGIQSWPASLHTGSRLARLQAFQDTEERCTTVFRGPIIPYRMT